jgi:hypothetical protein
MNMPVNGDWIGWLIGSVAVVLATVFYFKTRTTARLVYQWGGRHLVGGETADLPDEVAIYYKGSNVPRVSSSKLVFWNAGNLTIRGSDIVEADPLRIVLFENAKILRVAVTSVTRAVNSFELEVNPKKENEVLCFFDYLDPGDGVRIEILHTSERRESKMTGTVRGLPEGISARGRIVRFPLPPVRGFRTLTTAMGFLGLGATLYGISIPIIQSHFRSFWPLNIHLPREGRSAAIFIGLLYLFTGFFPLWVSRRRFPRALAEDD